MDALTGPEITEQPKKDRYRWAATQAGYAHTTSIASIIKPLRHLIVQAAESVLAEATVEAAWTLRDALTGEIEAFSTKIRLDAARDILDRVIPKKEAKAVSQAPLVQIILPAKQESVRVIEVKDEG
jgi:hypothetical protein